MHFADRLCQAIDTKGTSLMVGLDPRLDQLPQSLTRDVLPQDLDRVAHAFRAFCAQVIDVVAPIVPAVKPQAAFFERLGPAGMLALGQVIDYAKSRGLLVVLDGKRNDIGSTSAAYAAAYLGDKPGSGWGCDALTVNPYLGDDSLQPMIKHAQETGTAIFVLVKTSNPGSATFQDLQVDGRPVYEQVAAWVERQAAITAGDCGYGVVGAVVGATYPQQLAELRRQMPHAFLLVPGFGAQGGRAADVAAAWSGRHGALINSSRQIIFAYRAADDVGTDWPAHVRRAALDAVQQLQQASGQPKPTGA